MHDAKRKNLPPPNAYTLPEKKKYVLGVSSKSEKGSFHTDEAIVQAKTTPTVCYKDLGSLTALTKPRTRQTKIYDPLVKREDLHKKPKKDPLPDFGSYEVGKSFNYTAKASEYSQKWMTGPVVRFHEGPNKHKKHVPAASHYKITKQHFDRLSKSPPSLRINRH